MTTLDVLLILLAVLLVGWALFCVCLYFTEKVTKRKVALNSIFKEFRQKMWMTVGLGVVFFGLYLSVAFLGSSFNDPKARLKFFFMIYENPTLFIYVGLLIFASVSIAIYLVRMVIKHLYNTRRY